MRTAIDFAPGLHGHFLELVVNKYIYGIDFNTIKVFQTSGAVHAININETYQKNKLANHGHYSSFNICYPQSVDSVIFIDHASELDVVLLTNIYYRCHPDSVSVEDFDVQQIIDLHKNLLLHDSNLGLRNNWFAKLSERHFEHPSKQPNTNLPIYKFPYKSFFNLIDFCKELKKLSKFLDETFKFDSSLVALWNEFINRNQGWALYNHGNALIEKMLNEESLDIPDDWKLHAFINFQLSKLFDLYDGDLFDNEIYPATTLDLFEIVNNHIKNFDNRW